MKLMFILFLIEIFITDYRHFVINNYSCSMLLLIGLININNIQYLDLYLLITFLSVFVYLQQLGAGDLKMIASIYPYFGFINLIQIIWLSSLIAIIYHLITKQNKIAFGSCLSLASLAIILINSSR